MAEFNAQKVSKVKAVDPDANYSVKGTDGGGFANAKVSINIYNAAECVVGGRHSKALRQGGAFQAY